jgi:hypothetical protein
MHTLHAVQTASKLFKGSGGGGGSGGSEGGSTTKNIESTRKAAYEQGRRDAEAQALREADQYAYEQGKRDAKQELSMRISEEEHVRTVTALKRMRAEVRREVEVEVHREMEMEYLACGQVLVLSPPHEQAPALASAGRIVGEGHDASAGRMAGQSHRSHGYPNIRHHAISLLTYRESVDTLDDIPYDDVDGSGLIPTPLAQTLDLAEELETEQRTEERSPPQPPPLEWAPAPPPPSTGDKLNRVPAVTPGTPPPSTDGKIQWQRSKEL